MIKIEVSTRMLAPVEQVFSYTSNFENDPTWISTVSKVEKTSDGPIGIGSTFKNYVNFLGKTFHSEHEIVEYEPNKRVVIVSSAGPVPFKAHYLFQPLEAGIRFSIHIESEPAGFFKLAAPLVGRQLKTTFEQNLRRLKQLLEDSSTSPANTSPTPAHSEQV